MVRYTRVPDDEAENTNVDINTDPRRGPVLQLAPGPSRWLRLLTDRLTLSLLIFSALVMALAFAAPAVSNFFAGSHPHPPPPMSSYSCTPLTGADAPNITIYHDDVTLAPSPLPPSHADSDGEDIIRLFQTLGRSTVWKQIAAVPFEGDTFEPEGIVRLGPDRYVVSCGDWTERTQKYEGGAIINGTDRTAGKGFAHLIVYDGTGRRLADATITRPDVLEYHNGGIDYDGQFIWGTAAQYRPNTTASVYRADPATLQATHVLNYDDHLGGVVHDTHDNSITCLNWGSRNASTWDLSKLKPPQPPKPGSGPKPGPKPDGGDGDQTDAESCRPFRPKPRSVVRNPSYFVDYQDCKWLGRSAFYGGKSIMLCSGVATIGGYNLGGVALVDVETMVPLAEVPIPLETAKGVRMTQNPMDVSVEDGRLRFYWLPDQHESTLYVYEAQPDSPFQFGGGPQ
jgi:hypothetical protein